MSKRQIYHITLLGPQASGKGTQAKLLAEELKLEHLEMGNTLRNFVKQDTPLGRKVANKINRGKMVPVDLIIKIIRDRIKSTPKSRGFVFDGTPRRMSEINPLENALKSNSRYLTHVFYVWISQRETINRLSKRRSCDECGAPYIFGKTVSKRTTKCPKCGGKIVQRVDDTPEAIKQRLSLYHKKTSPVIEYYRQKRKLIEINGEQSIRKVFKDILSYL